MRVGYIFRFDRREDVQRGPQQFRGRLNVGQDLYLPYGVQPLSEQDSRRPHGR